MNSYSYTREIVDGQWNLNSTFSKAVELALPGKSFTTAMLGASVSVVFVETLTSAEVLVLDGVIEDEKEASGALSLVREIRCKEIDARTRGFFDTGFEFPPSSGIRYSLSVQSQVNLEVLDRNRTLPEMVYPVTWNSQDDTSALTIPDADAMHSFYLTALGTGRAYLDGGTALKGAIRAATTRAEIDAVVDTR